MTDVSVAKARPASQHDGQGSAGPAAGPISLLIRAVMLENLRRREFYVVLILMGLFLVGALIARWVAPGGRASAEAAGTLVLNLGLTLASISAHAIALLAAARQFPDEMERRTIYPLLAKPLGRGRFLVGKWLASWISGAATLLVLLPIALLPVGQAGPTAGGLFVEAILLQFASLGMISALAILGSLFLPKALNLVLVALLAGAGGAVLNMVRAHAAGKPFDGLVRWVTGYVPDFSRLDLTLAYTSGASPVSMPDLALRLFHALVFILFPLALATFLLKRRSL